MAAGFMDVATMDVDFTIGATTDVGNYGRGFNGRGAFNGRGYYGGFNGRSSVNRGFSGRGNFNGGRSFNGGGRNFRTAAASSRVAETASTAAGAAASSHVAAVASTVAAAGTSTAAVGITRWWPTLSCRKQIGNGTAGNCQPFFLPQTERPATKLAGEVVCRGRDALGLIYSRGFRETG